MAAGRATAHLGQLEQPFAVQAVSSGHFYTTRTEMAEVFQGRKQWLMEHFYRRMRQRHSVLIDEAGEPEGGQWNYDHDNRKPWPGTPHCRPTPAPRTTTAPCGPPSRPQACKALATRRPIALRWPLNRAEALAWLGPLHHHHAADFGAYEDAMSTKSARLFHSCCPSRSTPKCCARTRWCNAPRLPTTQALRPCLRWRALSARYWVGANMCAASIGPTCPATTSATPWATARRCPDWFWTGKTRMRCMQHAVGQSLEQAYAHHIQRLMVIGNFALLAGLDPAAVHRWYLGVYIDAFEWVEVPNTVGMSQFADGGLLATKPYVSSAAYIDRMSDYCSGCHYDKSKSG